MLNPMARGEYGTERNHLLERLYQENNDHFRKLQKKFGFIQTSPSSFEEFKEWIISGRAHVPDVYENEDFSVYRLSYFPKGHKPDSKGLKEEGDKLQTAFKRATDRITVLPLAEGLKALEEFERFYI